MSISLAPLPTATVCSIGTPVERTQKTPSDEGTRTAHIEQLCKLRGKRSRTRKGP
jgi:hypothetical protein